MDTAGFIAILVSSLLGAAGTIGLLFKLLIASKDREFALVLKEREADKAELIAIKLAYKDIAADAFKSTVATTNYYREKYEGLPPLILTAPVIPESNSPSTEKQRESAYIQTLRAGMEQLKLVAGQEPRPEPEKAVEVPEGAITKVEMEQLKAGVEAAPEAIADKVVEKLEKRKDV